MSLSTDIYSLCIKYTWGYFDKKGDCIKNCQHCIHVDAPLKSYVISQSFGSIAEGEKTLSLAFSANENKLLSESHETKSRRPSSPSSLHPLM